MPDSAPATPLIAADASTLKADLAFFEARLSLASGMADTSYQRAQSKVFQVLGEELAGRLAQMGAGAVRKPSSACDPDK
jgi:hypothetical protein